MVLRDRADWIRTSDLLNPIQAHYQAVLRPDLFKLPSGAMKRLSERRSSGVNVTGLYRRGQVLGTTD